MSMTKPKASQVVFDPAGVGAVATTVQSKLRETVSVKDFGAVGDGVTNDTSAIQAAIDYLVSVGGGTLLVPDPEISYKIVGSLQLASYIKIVGQTPWRNIEGGSTSETTFVGDGTNPIFKTGVYPAGVGTANRNIVLENFSARNNGAEVVSLLSANNFKIIRCGFATYSFADSAKGTVNVRFSYRGEIKGCWIGASGGAWALSMYDNCNGVSVQDNVISGGSAGGAVDIGQSSNVRVNGSIIESSLKGIRVGASGVTGAGQCLGVNLDDNYIEATGSPYEIGVGFNCYGVSILRGLISNASLSYTESSPFVLGRVTGWQIGRGTSVFRKTGGTASLFEFKYIASAPYMAINGDASGIYYTGGAGGYYTLTSFTSSVYLGYLTGLNKLEPVFGKPSSVLQSWESPAITANVGRSSLAEVPVSVYGGVVDAVEVFEATGTLACNVYIGTGASYNEIAGFDPSALSLTAGSGQVTITDGASPVSGAVLFRAGESMRLYVTAGAGTGTFKVRVKWRGLAT